MPRKKKGKVYNLQVRLTPEMARTAKRCAAARGMPVTSWIRQFILDAAESA